MPTYTEDSKRPFGIPEPPTFYPTTDEFSDSYNYINSIAEEGKKYGIVKVVPPSSWNPSFSLDTGV